MSKSDIDSNKKKQNKTIRWVVAIFLSTIIASALITLVSEEIMATSSMAIAFVILLVIVFLGIITDVIGVAVTSAGEIEIDESGEAAVFLYYVGQTRVTVDQRVPEEAMLVCLHDSPRFFSRLYRIAFRQYKAVILESIRTALCRLKIQTVSWGDGNARDGTAMQLPK